MLGTSEVRKHMNWGGARPARGPSVIRETGGDVYYGPGVIPDCVLRDLNRRLSAKLTISQLALGDPPFCRSALARKSEPEKPYYLTPELSDAEVQDAIEAAEEGEAGSAPREDCNGVEAGLPHANAVPPGYPGPVRSGPGGRARRVKAA